MATDEPAENASGRLPEGYWRVLGHADEVYRLCEDASGLLDAWAQWPSKPDCTCRMEDDGPCVRLEECELRRWAQARHRVHEWLRRFGWTEEEIARSDEEHTDG